MLVEIHQLELEMHQLRFSFVPAPRSIRNGANKSLTTMPIDSPHSKIVNTKEHIPINNVSGLRSDDFIIQMFALGR